MNFRFYILLALMVLTNQVLFGIKPEGSYKIYNNLNNKIPKNAAYFKTHTVHDGNLFTYRWSSFGKRRQTETTPELTLIKDIFVKENLSSILTLHNCNNKLIAIIKSKNYSLVAPQLINFSKSKIVDKPKAIKAVIGRCIKTGRRCVSFYDKENKYLSIINRYDFYINEYYIKNGIIEKEVFELINNKLSYNLKERFDKYLDLSELKEVINYADNYYL